jgi:hypothetical protein
LHAWAERLENWGQILFIILFILGIASTIMNTINVADVDEDMALVTCVTTFATWGIYVFIEYCAYHVLALLISALASITQNTIITANVALYEAAKNTSGFVPVQTTTAPTPVAAPTPVTAPTPVAAQTPVTNYYNPPVVKTASLNNMWVCKYCGTHNKNEYGQCKKCGKFRT